MMSFGDDTLDPSVEVEAQLRVEVKRLRGEIAEWRARYERDVAIDPAEAEHLRTVAHELRLTADVFEAERDRLRERVANLELELHGEHEGCDYKAGLAADAIHTLSEQVRVLREAISATTAGHPRNHGPDCNLCDALARTEPKP